ncbi:MAG: SCP2 domain-containing protein [Acidiferrobacterales bacterium]
MNEPGFLVNVLEQVVNRLVRLDGESLDRLAPFEGKVIRLCIAGGVPFASASEIYVLPTAAGLRLLSNYDDEVDVTLRGTLPTFLRLLRGGARLELFAAGELETSGDVELGRRFQRVMENLDIDWEEQVSHVVGDVAAHKLGNFVRDARAWQRQSAQTLGADLAEYLQEESRVLATRARVEAFLEAVDVLRADTDRLEARLRRLREHKR